MYLLWAYPLDWTFQCCRPYWEIYQQTSVAKLVKVVMSEHKDMKPHNVTKQAVLKHDSVGSVPSPVVRRG